MKARSKELPDRAVAATVAAIEIIQQTGFSLPRGILHCP